MSVKISSLVIENTKRVKAVAVTPTENGLTVIGGKNNQGKTSVLDAITYALGGEKYRPGNIKRDGSMTDPYLRIVLNNGLIVERKGKNSTLQVTDPSGKKAGQSLLNSFISTFALDLPKFLQASDKDKAKALLQIIGVEAQLAEYDREEDRLSADRLATGRIAKQKRGAAEQLTEWDNVPDEPVSAAELIRQQQEILARNGENQRKRNNLAEITRKKEQLAEDARRLEEQIKELQNRLGEKKAEYAGMADAERIASLSVKDLQDESTAELEANIAGIDTLNAKIRDNMTKAKAVQEAENYEAQYKDLGDKIARIRESRMQLLQAAPMPLPGLSVDHGALIYNGQPWDGMSSSEQLRVATAIVRKLNPECGFVLLDKLEQMDLDTMNDFATWLQKEGLQAIATRVSTGGECTIYIEDGYSVDHDGNKTAETEIKPADAFVPHELGHEIGLEPIQEPTERWEF